MNKTEYLLTCLSEECAELSKEASKALRFGLNDKEPAQDLSNVEKIINEFNDIVGIMELLKDNRNIAFFVDLGLIKKKKEKVKKWMKYARKKGTLK